MNKLTRGIIDAVGDEYYLRTIHIRVDEEICDIGLFKCPICSKPITDRQFNFAKNCAECDTTAGSSDKWVVEKPRDDFK